MNEFGNYVLLFFLGAVLLAGILRKIPVFDAFLDGAKGGIETAVKLLPSLLALLFAVNLLTASGIMEQFVAVLSPIFEKLHYPAEVLPLCLLSPISGSGSLSAFQTILTSYGADSYIGRVASVIAGSTETTFYAIAVYYGAVGIKKTRHTAFAALCADCTSFVLAALFVRLFFD
ncbi:MAG: spore maturation protein [Candidatus Fimenecus sp.]